MKLSNFELYAGCVIDANDPKHLSRVKASAPGLFDNSTMNVNDMFWINPFTSSGYQKVSKPQEGQKIWILRDTTNEYGYWYMPYPELNLNTTAAIQNDDTDVLVSRTGAGVGSQMYYNRDEGFVTRVSTSATSTMTSGGDIKNNSNGAQVSMTGGQVFIGHEKGDNHPMVYGDKLVDVLNSLKSNLSNLAMTAAGSWTTVHLAKDLNKAVADLNQLTDPILADKMFLVS